MAKPEQFSVFVPLLKVDEEQRLVYGVMAEEVLDNSGEIFDYSSSKPHFEKWSDDTFNASGGMSKGNLRVMHGSVAAGKLTDISFDDETKRIECCAKVVDDNEWDKVLEGVYTGFSIGGRYEKRWVDKADDGAKATRYTAKPVEVSLVDKPCIPTATFQMIKKDGLVEDRLFKTVLGESETGDEAEDLIKSEGVDEMNTEYTPTNDELLPVARELAKTETGDESNWLNFMAKAEEELITKYGAKKKEEKPLVDEEREEALEGNAGADDASSDSSEEKEEEEEAEKADGGIDEAQPKKTSEQQKKEEEEDTAVKGDDGDDTEEGDEDMDKKKKAEKADFFDLEQVWLTSDGQKFAIKKDAIAHEKSVRDPSLTDLIKAAKYKLASEDMEAEKADDEGDYGDVEYADLGYQEDKKPRYPIDTAEHIRAAWNYIHQEKNAALYSAEQAKKIKSRIVRAWKDTIDEEGPPSAQKMSAFGDLTKAHELVTSDEYVTKGMWEVSRMADVLSSVACMQQCLANEAVYEGDNSPIPLKLKDAVTNLGTIMVEMVAEEVGELVASLKSGGSESEVAESPMMALAASTLGLEKSDADELAKSMIAAKAMGRIQKMHDHTMQLGAKCMKAEASEEEMNEESMATEKMAKFESVNEENELLKADLAGQKEEIAEAKNLIKSLMADMDKIKNTPMPSAPRTHVIGKGEDASGPAQDAPDLSKMTKEQLADLAIRMAQSGGNSMLTR